MKKVILISVLAMIVSLMAIRHLDAMDNHIDVLSPNDVNSSGENNIPKSFDYTLYPSSVDEINDVIWNIIGRFNNNEKDRFRVALNPGTYSYPIEMDFYSESSSFTDLYVEIHGVNGPVYLPGDNFISNSGGNLHFLINNVSISGGSRGIRAYAEPDAQAITFLEVWNCEIYENVGINSGVNENMDGAGIYSNGPTLITNCHIYDNIARNWISPDLSNLSHGGGIAVINNTTYKTEIKNCYIYGNSANSGGGIFVSGSAPIEIVGNRIYENERSVYYDDYGNIWNEGFGLGVYALDCESLKFKDNVVYGHEHPLYRIPLPEEGAVVIESCGYSRYVTSVTVENNSIMDNGYSYGLWLMMPEGGTMIRNNLSCGNAFGFHILTYTGGYISLKYNNAYNNSNENYRIPNPAYVFSSNNYELDPQIDSAYAPLWTSSVFSWMIDGGDPAVTDPDGTPSDIGAIRAEDHDYWSYQFRSGSGSVTPPVRGEPYHWVSYPVVNSLTPSKRVARSFFHELLGKHVNSNGDYEADVLDEILWYDGNMAHYIIWNGGDWDPIVDTHHVTSPQGYKIKLLPLGDPMPIHYPPVVLHHSGFQTPDTTPFMIYGSLSNGGVTYENWIGYFGTESVWPTDAFSSILDDITMIQAKDWTLYGYPGSGLMRLRGVMRPLNPGDMVVVTTLNDHNFRWNESTVPTDPIVKDKPIAFIYEEKADYTPVYIDLSDVDTTNLKEIGLIHDGVCKGAVVVTDPLEQICAYLDDDESLSSGSVELEFVYDSKNPLEALKTIVVNHDQLSSSFIGGDPAYPVHNIKITDADLSNEVVPVLSLEQNYPNPFNPTTTIRYSIDEPGMVSLDIYNIKGQLVKSLYRGNAEVGNHSVIWNGLDNSGKACASGVYFYKLRTSKTSLVQKMLLMK